MNARINIIGILVFDAQNIQTKQRQEKGLIKVCVRINNVNTYIDCFYFKKFSDNQLMQLKKGCICSINGKYNNFVGVDLDKIYHNRIINIFSYSHLGYNLKIQNEMKIFFVGYVFLCPKIEDNKTKFTLIEKKYSFENDNPRQFICHINYALKEEVLKNISEEDSLIFVSGNYRDFIENNSMKRIIEVNDYEFIERSVKNLKIGNLKI